MKTSWVADGHICRTQGDIVVLDAGSRPGASKITTADDCCNACRQNDQVSACGETLRMRLCRTHGLSPSP